MTFEQYASGNYAIYRRFATTVRFILEEAIAAAQGVLAPQSIQARAKDPDRLRDRLEEANQLQASNIEEVRKDLAGVRLIFYTNNDVERFLGARLIFENFEIEQNATKVHYPSAETGGSRYQALHYIVQLKADRAALPEYCKFADLRCEIQIQTILNHAWSETTHDIVYKDKPREGFGKRAMEAITKRVNDIMDNYLLPANYEFQRIQHDYERLQQGKELFDRDVISTLLGADNNNDRYETLEALQKYVLPEYDDVPAIFGDLRNPLVKVAIAARNTPTTPIKTTFGEIDGYTAAQVESLIVEIFNTYRYIEVGKNFDALGDIFVGEQDETVKNKILETVGNMTQHDMLVWRSVGPQIQMVLISHFERINPSTAKAVRPLLLRAYGEILGSEIHGTTWDQDTVTIHRGAVPVSPELKEIRTRAIDAVFAMLLDDDVNQEVRPLFHILDTAKRISADNPSNELIALGLTDSKRIVDFVTLHWKKFPYDVLEHFEYLHVFQYRQACQIRDAENDRFGSKEEAQDDLIAIEQFRDTINANREYFRYKILVGFDAVFDQDWTDEDINYQLKDQFRRAHANLFITEITEENSDEWFALIEHCVATKSNDLATFPVFGYFIVALAKAKPVIAEIYLNRAGTDLLDFLTGFLDGFYASDNTEVYNRVFDTYLSRKTRLFALARHWRNSVPNEPAAAQAILKAAIETNDNVAVTECLTLAFELWGTDNIPAREDFFVPAINHLNEQKDARWVRNAWFLQSANNFFASITREDSALLLENLVNLSRVNFEAERILSKLAEYDLEGVWAFFTARRVVETEGKRGSDYDAIPFELNALRPALASDPTLALSVTRPWFDEDPALFRFRGGRLLANAFPSLPPEFADELTKRVTTGGDMDADFVLEITQSYKGEPELHSILKEIVAHFPDDNSKTSRVASSIDSMGVVSGELGLVDAYRHRRALVQSWLKDGRPAVVDFAKSYIQNVDRNIIAEQKRADERREMRRRDFRDVEE